MQITRHRRNQSQHNVSDISTTGHPVSTAICLLWGTGSRKHYITITEHYDLSVVLA
uniref:Uncharacterized protein n=1 Tax=Anguilla anguilla TaxID=7936 RepID=A0A0E9RLA3_ANGAN